MSLLPSELWIKHVFPNLDEVESQLLRKVSTPFTDLILYEPINYVNWIIENNVEITTDRLYNLAKVSTPEDLIKMRKKYNDKIRSDIFLRAISKHGTLSSLKWMYENNLFNKTEHSHFHHEEYHSIEEQMTILAIKYGHLNILTFLYNIGVIWNNEYAVTAIKFDKFECFKFLCYRAGVWVMANILRENRERLIMEKSDYYSEYLWIKNYFNYDKYMYLRG